MYSWVYEESWKVPFKGYHVDRRALNTCPRSLLFISRQKQAVEISRKGEMEKYCVLEW